MIRARDLRFSYEASDFSLSLDALDVEAGSRAAIVGPSGSGKTTLLSLLSGILAPTAGKITAFGTDVTALSDAGRRRFRIENVGFVFQDFALVEYLSVRDNVLHPYRLNPALRLDDTILKRADALLGDVGLSSHALRLVGRLSQGERQRVAVCRALIARPKLVLADEATGNLDPKTRDVVLSLLEAYVTERNGEATLLAVTHDHATLERYDQVIRIGGEAP